MPQPQQVQRAHPVVLLGDRARLVPLDLGDDPDRAFDPFGKRAEAAPQPVQSQVRQPGGCERLRALAVTTKTRSPSAPDVPTMEESGVAPFDVTSWFGMLAPKGTPKDVVGKINKVMNNAFDKPEIQQAYARLGAIAEKNTPQQYAEFIRTEVRNWAPVVKASGARVD